MVENKSPQALATPADILKTYWHFDAFRPKQEEIISAVLDGQDTLALLPTGGGKSICFQVPALCMEGLCLVVSPLIALMLDQVENLKRKGIAAAAVTSFASLRETDRLLEMAVQGQLKFLYLSPERLRNEMFKLRLPKMKVTLLAVDEAHCISQWGYDFRPAYLQVAEIRKSLPGVPVIALTATATPAVVKDIQEKLDFVRPHVISSSFRRENLVYAVAKTDDKFGKILSIINKSQGSGIVYGGTRQRTKEVAQYLRNRGLTAAFYHAGLSQHDRMKAQERWLRGEDRIICATNAFGMGIDKPDVRLVVHADVTASLESYFQEAGRAGRDGQTAAAVMLYNEQDIIQLSRRIEQHFPPPDYMRKVYRSLGAYLQVALGAGEGTAYPFSLNDFCARYSLESVPTFHAIGILERAGYLAFSEGFMQPSRLSIIVTRTALYDIQVRYPNLDRIIKLLLRLYGGLFETYVNIREDEVARAAQVDEKEVIHQLQLMHKQGIVDYAQRSDAPQISYVVPRLSEDRLRFPDDIYQERKTAETERAQAVIHYLQDNQCRSRLLLSYFGERNSDACGRCDACRENRAHGFSMDEYTRMNHAMTDLLLKERVRLDQLGERLPEFPLDKLHELASWKLDRGELTLNDRLELQLSGLDE